ncbi:MAG: hypothetical protein EOM52_12220 [Clostridia bacterium]|nr:hypothetical protein [Clostridia bacterium]
MAAPLAGRDVDISVLGRMVSRPYVDVTLDMMRRFGLKIDNEGTSFHVRHGQSYHSKDYTVPGDFSSAAFPMAAAALCELFGMRVGQIEYAAEMAIEHHLGLTCDPIGGLVQIPCIERNAVAAMRAINALNLANFLADTRKISFDMVVETMYHTGRDLLCQYRETSEGGLAKSYR